MSMQQKLFGLVRNIFIRTKSHRRENINHSEVVYHLELGLDG